MWLIYQAAMLFVLLVAGPFLLVRRGRHHVETLSGRLGRSQEPPKTHPLWVHAVSVGEVEVAKTFLQRLNERFAPPNRLEPLVTTVTPTGQARARAALGSFARIAYFPFELGFAQSSFLRTHQPKSLVLVEGELWPLMLHKLKARQTPVVMINGRISDRSFARLEWIYGRWPSLLRPLVGSVTHFGVQSQQDCDRLEAIGVDTQRITVTGNLKFDAEAPPELKQLGRLIAAMACDRPIVVAGSTMPGEESIVLDALERLQDRDPLLILAPRHPERFEEAYQLCKSRSFSAIKRSTLQKATGPPEPSPVQVLLLDTLGELASTYRWASAAFVGGTLVPTGGHNPLEPARCSAPVCVGPSMENFPEMAQAFDSEQAWRRVASAQELADTWRCWLEQPDDAKRVAQLASGILERNRGATQRSIDLVRECIPTLSVPTIEDP